MKYLKIIIICLVFLNIQGCTSTNSNKEIEKVQTDSMKISSDTLQIKNDDLIKSKQADEIKIGFVGDFSYISGLGRVTFYTNHRALFYFDRKTNSGEIQINDSIHKLINEAGQYENYKYYGKNLEIVTSEFKMIESEGGDCIYGSVSQVSIKLNGKTKILKNIDVQDCPNY